MMSGSSVDRQPDKAGEIDRDWDGIEGCNNRRGTGVIFRFHFIRTLCGDATEMPSNRMKERRSVGKYCREEDREATAAPRTYTHLFNITGHSGRLMALKISSNLLLYRLHYTRAAVP